MLLGGCGGANGAGTDAAFGRVLFDCQVEPRTSNPVLAGSDGSQDPPLRRRLDLLEHSASYLAIEGPSTRDVLASTEDLTRPVALPVREYVARIGWRLGWATAQHRWDCPARETRRFRPLPAGRQRIAGWIGDERFERTIVLANGEVTRVVLD